MNRKQLILLLFVLTILGGAGMVLMNRNRDSWSAPAAKLGDKVLPHFEPNDVAAIHIRSATDLNLVRKGNTWRVREHDDYPANFGQISDVLLKLKDLKVVEADTVGPSELSRVDLDEPGRGATSGTLVEFKDGQGKVIEALLLGRKHISEISSSPLNNNATDGRYILLTSNPREVLLISDALNSLQPNPQSWLNKDFFKAEKIKSIQLASDDAAKSWKISRETESSPWTLADAATGEILDTNKAARAANAFTYPNFVDVVSNNSPAAVGLDKPAVVDIQTFDHFDYSIKIGAKSPEGVRYLTVGVTAQIPAGDEARKLQDKLAREQTLAPWVYAVNAWILDPVLRDRAQMLEEKKDEKAAADDNSGPISSPFITDK